MQQEMNSNTIEEYIRALIPVSVEAGKAILEIYNRVNISIQKKDDASPLTEADLASNKIICEGLKRISPHIPIISEENEHLPFNERSTWPYCWVVDPLDGTKEFIKKNGEFTTNIGLVYDHKVIAGVVYIPVLGELYYAISGKGAYKIANQETHRIKANSFTIKDEGLTVICSRSHMDELTHKFIASLNSPKLISKGSSLKFTAIAEGKADLYPRMAPTMEWDTCAAQIILEEAGGKVVIHESENNPVSYNKENLLNPFFIAKGCEST